MVDVSDKAETDRVAVAGARVVMRPETLARIRAGDVAKGDVLAVARIAGIMAAKRTAELIPLCHPLALTSVAVDLACVPERSAVEITATCRLQGPHRGRDGSADRGQRRGADDLRHVQGDRPRRWSSPICACCSKSGGKSGELARQIIDDLGRRSPGAPAGAARSRAARAGVARRRGRPRAGRGCRGAPHPAAFRGLGDGRLRGARRGCGAGAGRRCASSPRSRPGPGSAARSAPARRRASLPARRCRTAPTRS